MLDKTQLAFEAAVEHINGPAAGSPQSALVRSYLGSYCAFLFCSEMEEKLTEILRGKLEKHNVGRISHFIVNTNKGMLKRVNKTDIASFVESFGDDAKQEFNSAFPDTEVTKYSNVVLKRHAQAHGGGGGVTLEEIALAIPVANKILARIGEVIDGSPGQ